MNPNPVPKARLFIEAPLSAGALLALDEKPSHYLSHVLRLKEGDSVALFNGRDGEWRATLQMVAKRGVTVQVAECLRPHRLPPDHWLLFAPIKSGRIDLVVEKATELGVRGFGAVKTARTVVGRVNEERLRAHAIEAAEQTGRVEVPELFAYRPLEGWLHGWDVSRRLVVCDETGSGQTPSVALPPHRGQKAALLIGPEGGFTQAELERLRALPYVVPMTLGPRVLRADTAAIAALTCLQLHLGDWDEKPAFRTTGA
jgi:16S rRNA (uracil1498-N3)-methyltransferase